MVSLRSDGFVAARRSIFRRAGSKGISLLKAETAGWQMTCKLANYEGKKIRTDVEIMEGASSYVSAHDLNSSALYWAFRKKGAGNFTDRN